MKGIGSYARHDEESNTRQQGEAHDPDCAGSRGYFGEII
jgi:hypothetical protein